MTVAKDHEASSLLELIKAGLGAVYHATPVTRADGETGPLEVDATGNLRVGITADVHVDIDESSLATAAAQTAGNTSLTSIDTKVTGLATTTLQTTGNASLTSIDTKVTGLATTALQTTGNTALASIDGKTHGPWLPVFTLVLATKLIIKATAGTIRAISGRVDATAPTATYYVQLWNAADVPVDTTAVSLVNSLMSPQKIQHTLGLDDRFTLDFAAEGELFGTGATLGLSTTEFTKTAAGAYMTASAEYS